MPDFYYLLPIVSMHLLFLAFSFFWIIRSDMYGSKWVFSKVEKLSKEKLDKMHFYVNIGLWGMIITGSMMILQKPYVLESAIFKIKMSFVIILFINSFVIGHLMKLSSRSRFGKLNLKDKLCILIAGTISTVSWLGAFISAILR